MSVFNGLKARKWEIPSVENFSAIRVEMLNEAFQDDASRLSMLDEAVQDEAARPPMLDEVIQERSPMLDETEPQWDQTMIPNFLRFQRALEHIKESSVHPYPTVALRRS